MVPLKECPGSTLAGELRPVYNNTQPTSALLCVVYITGRVMSTYAYVSQALAGCEVVELTHRVMHGGDKGVCKCNWKEKSSVDGVHVLMYVCLCGVYCERFLLLVDCRRTAYVQGLMGHCLLLSSMHQSSWSIRYEWVWSSSPANSSKQATVLYYTVCTSMYVCMHCITITICYCTVVY